MKKSSARIREQMARLRDQLKEAETREADRIGRVALKAGLGEIDTDEDDLLAAFEEIAARFQGGQGKSERKRGADTGGAVTPSSSKIETGTSSAERPET